MAWNGHPVIDLDAHPDRRGARFEHVGERGARGFLDQGHDARRAEHVDGARAERTRGVGRGDHQLGVAAQTDRQLHGKSR